MTVLLTLQAPLLPASFGLDAGHLSKNQPGCIVGIVFSGDVHDFSTPVVAVGNFFFYFGLTYLLITVGRKFRVWEKYKEKYSSRPNTNGGKGNSKM